MKAVRSHHNYTYRHSMMVCGYLVSFAHLIGVRGDELQMLALGGLVHDIGKAKVPVEILDKPDSLNAEEWEFMTKHPEYSKEIFEADGTWERDIVDMAVLHHERLDGTGYPYRKLGSEITDMARMTAIADVFSGLIDKRAYKKAMSPAEAYEIMLAADGHLERSLVEAFRPIALDCGS